MAHEGKYIYCIINGNDGRNFGPIGIGGRGDIVSTIGYNEISAVFSNTPMSQYVISRENLTDHEKVIEKVMQDYTILPARFCTIASNAEEIRTLLRRRYSELKGLFRKMDNKVEMGVKISWKNLNQVLREIAQTDSAVQDIRSKSQGLPILDTTVQIEAGKALHRALCQKKRGGNLAHTQPAEAHIGGGEREPVFRRQNGIECRLPHRPHP